MRGLLGSAYRRASAVSAGLCEFRERLQDPSSLAPFVFSDTTTEAPAYKFLESWVLSSFVFLDTTPAMVGCFWPIFLFADHNGAGRLETNQVRCARMNK